MKYLSNPSVVKGLFTALLLLAASVARPQSANPDTPSYTMRSGGIERSYKLHLPQGLPQGAPLVVVLHGYGGNNDPGRFGLNAAADRHGFAVRRARRTAGARRAGTQATRSRRTWPSTT